MKKARSQKLKRFNKVLSVLLAAAMVAGSVPETSFAAEAAETQATEETTEETTSEAVSYEEPADTDPGTEEAADEVPQESQTSELEPSSENSTEGNEDTPSETTSVEPATEESKDNTTEEESVETEPAETEAASVETETVPAETISEEAVEEESVEVLAEAITVTVNKTDVTSELKFAVADTQATTLEQFQSNDLTWGEAPESITPDSSEGKEAKNKFLYIKVTEADKKTVSLKNGASGSEQEVTVAATDTQNAKIKYYCIEVVDANAVTLTFTETEVETPPTENKHQLSISVVDTEGVAATNAAVIKTGDSDGTINDAYTEAVEVEENADKYIEVKAAEGYEVLSVKNGEEALEPVSGKTDVYKVTMGTEDIALVVTVKKVYTITIPASVEKVKENTYKLSVKKGSESATAPEVVTGENRAQEGLSAGDMVTVTFDVAIDADKETEVTYTVGGETKTVEPKAETADTATYEIELKIDAETPADIEVTAIAVNQSDLYALSLSEDTTGVTAKYLAVPASNPTEVKVADFKNLEANTKVKVGKYYLLLSAAGKVIDEVTYGSNTPATAVIIDNTTVYQVTVSDAAVAVKATVAESVSVPVTKGSNVKDIYYTTDSTVTAYTGSESKFLKATGNAIVVKKDSTIKFHVEYDKYYEVDTVTINGTEEELKKDLFELNTAASLDEGKSLGFAVTAKHITITYTISALADLDDETEGAQTKGSITFDKANIISYQVGEDESVTTIPDDGVVVSDKETKIVVNAGDKIIYRLSADTGYEASATGVDATKRADASGNVYYTFTAETAATIKTTITPITAKTVTFDVENGEHIKSVMTYIGEATEGVTVTFADGKTTEPDYGKAFSFTIGSIDEGYAIDYVTYSTDGEIWTVLEANEGKYVFTDGITENTTIRLVEKYDSEKVNTFTVEFDNAYAKVEQVTSASDANEGTSVDSEKPVQVLGQYAYIRVTPTAGYKASVKIADAEAEEIKAAKIYTIDFGADAVKVSKAVTVTSAIDESITVEGKRFVKIVNNDAAAELKVKTAEGITASEVDDEIVYEIDGAAVKEVEFTVTIPETKEYVYEPVSPVIKTAQETSNGNTVYTYKIVVNQIANTATEAAKAQTITLGQVRSISAAITLEGAYNAGVSKVVINDNNEIKVTNKIDAVAGDKVVIALEDHYALYEVGENDPVTNEPNETKLDLDYYNMYTYTAKEEKTFKIVGEDTSKYTTKINGKAVSQIEAKNNDEVSIQVFNDKNEVLEITKVDLDKAASRYTVSEDKQTVKITVSPEDAAKSIKAALYADVDRGDGALVETKVGEAEIIVSPLAAGVTVKNGKATIKNKAVVKIDGLKEVSYDLTFAPADVETSYFEAKAEDGKNVTAEIRGSKLFITTGAEDEEAKVTIVDKNKTEGNELFTMTVKTSKPVLKVSKVESASAGMKDINLTLTGDKAIAENRKPGTYAYYKVVAAPAETSKVGEAKPAGNPSYTYYIPFAATTSYNAVVNNAADITKAAWTYDFTVSVVIAGNQVSAGTTAPATILAESKTPVKKSFTTRNAYYEDKLGLKKKTTNIFNGQINVVAATVSFSKNASYIESADVTVIDKDGVTVSDIRGVVDTTTGEVKISVNSSVTAGKYTAIVSAVAKTETVGDTENVQTMYRASANLPITVKASQYYFSSNAPAKLALSTKDVNFALKVTATDANETKSAVQKFSYELVSSTGSELNDSIKTQKNIKENVVVNAKNGKITIKKSFKCSEDPADNIFGVKVLAADWAGNPKAGLIKIEVTNKAMTIGKIYLLNEDDEPFSGEITVGSELELVVEDTEGNDITDYVTFTPAYKSGKNSVGYNYGTPYFLAFKPAKNLAIKATTTDGGKKSATLKVNVAYKKFTQMSYTLLYSSVGIDEVSANTYEYKSINGGHFGIRVEDIINGTRHVTVPSDYNYKVTVKGATMTSGYVWDQTDREYKYTYEIIPNAEVTTISIKNPEVRTPAVITLKNLAFVKTAAPKATTKDKFYMNNVDADGNTKVQHMTYTVAKGTYECVNVVYVSGDYVAEKGTFEIESDNTFTVSTPDDRSFAKALTGKYTFTYGKLENGRFVPQTKPANVTIKVNKSAEFKPTASYTITPTDSTVIALAGKPNEVISSFGGVRFSDLQNANVKGQPNKFRDIFTLNENGTLTLNTAAANLNELIADKNNLTGYVTYQYYKYSSIFRDWQPVTKTTKITVKVDTKDKKYKADAVDVLKGASSTIAVTTVRLNKDAAALLENGAVIADAASGWTAAVANPEDAAAGRVTLTAASPTPGKNKVQFKIIPRNSSVILTDLAAKGITVEATVNVLDPAVYAKKLTVKKGATAIDLANAQKSYDPAKKTGVFTYTVSASNVYTLVNGAVVKTITAAEGTKEGYAIKLEDGNVVITANANAVEKGKSYVLTANVAFDNGVDETIKFTVKAPKTIADAASVKAAVETYLAAFSASGSDTAAQTTDAKKISDELSSKVIDPITGITVKTVTPVYTAAQDAVGGTPAVPASYKVTVVLTDPNPAEGALADIEFKDVAVKEPSQTQDLEAAQDAVQALVNKIVGENSTNEEAAKTEKLASELTSSLALRAYLVTAITNPDIMLEISSFEYEAAKDGTAEKPAGTSGSLTFTCKVFTQTEVSSEISKTIEIPANDYKAPSGN